MVEFGEKLKRVREERGLTQQSLAERLYVTRQAVSRWECGARYPDLLTAKKVSTILDVSLDELLSGEEFVELIEKAPVLEKPVENILQTILYAWATIIYFLLSIFSMYELIDYNEALQNTPAGQVSLHMSDVTRMVLFGVTLAGCILSSKNKLNAPKIGCIMSVPYIMSAISSMVLYGETQIKGNGYISVLSLLVEVGVPILFAICILLFFGMRDRRLPKEVICGISALTILYLIYCYQNRFARFTNIGFVITTTHMVGKIGMAILLGYQAIVWDKKRKFACKKILTL